MRTQVRRKRYAESLRDECAGGDGNGASSTRSPGSTTAAICETHLVAMLEQAAHTGRPLSVMMLDIDHFKTVNDTMATTSATKCCTAFAARVKRVVRGADLMCRLGGEEFVVVMPETRLSIARRVAERVRATVAATPFPIRGGADALSDHRVDRRGRIAWRRNRRRRVQARRPGALSVEDRRPQPRDRCGKRRGGVVSPSINGSSPKALAALEWRGSCSHVGGMTTFRLRIAQNLADVAPDAWDACANPSFETAPSGPPQDEGRCDERFNPFLTHAFLHALETTGCVGGRTGWSPAHVLIESDEEAGRLRAGLFQEPFPRRICL